MLPRAKRRVSSIIYNSLFEDTLTGKINFSVDTFKCLLVTAEYIPYKKVHTRRSNILHEATGRGYTSGGTIVNVSIMNDTENDRTYVSLGSASWQSSTLTAAGAVYYKSRGGPKSADELIAFIEFTEITTSINGPFSISEMLLWIDS